MLLHILLPIWKTVADHIVCTLKLHAIVKIDEMR